MAEFKPDQLVLVYENGYTRQPPRVECVQSVSALKVTLCNGSVWRARDGRAWGTPAGAYGVRRISPATDEEAEKAALDRKRYDLAEYLGRVKWHEMPLDKMKQVLETIALEKTT